MARLISGVNNGNGNGSVCLTYLHKHTSILLLGIFSGSVANNYVA